MGDAGCPARVLPSDCIAPFANDVRNWRLSVNTEQQTVSSRHDGIRSTFILTTETWSKLQHPQHVPRFPPDAFTEFLPLPDGRR